VKTLGRPRPSPAGGAGPVAVRAFRPRDLPTLSALERLVFGPAAWPSSAFTRLAAPAGRGPVRGRLWVATRSARVVGYLALEISVLGDEADLASLAVHPDHRRQGLARVLVRHALAHARRRGLGLVWLRVRPSGRAARRLYAALRFRVVGRLGGYYDRPREAAIVMARRP
jgi:ribosomal-protein-alanine N-acetyltransferase